MVGENIEYGWNPLKKQIRLVEVVSAFMAAGRLGLPVALI